MATAMHFDSHRGWVRHEPMHHGFRAPDHTPAGQPAARRDPRASSLPRDLSRTPTPDLIHAARTGNAATRAAAQAELQRRG